MSAQRLRPGARNSFAFFRSVVIVDAMSQTFASPTSAPSATPSAIGQPDIA
jgi:hypothetical protein